MNIKLHRLASFHISGADIVTVEIPPDAKRLKWNMCGDGESVLVQPIFTMIDDSVTHGEPQLVTLDD